VLFFTPLSGGSGSGLGFDASFLLRFSYFFTPCGVAPMNDERVSADTIRFPKNQSNAPTRPGRRVTTRHYFVLENGMMRGVDCEQMEKSWLGEAPWPNDGDVRILTVLHKKPENIVGCFFVLVSVVNGKFDRESIEEANNAEEQQAQQPPSRAKQYLPGFLRQKADWPADWKQQVATALGIDADLVRDAGVGGPLLRAITRQRSIAESARKHASSLFVLYGTTPPTTTIDDELHGSIAFTTASSLQPWGGDPTHYLLEFSGTVVVANRAEGADDDPQPAGDLKLLVVKMSEARKAGVPVCDICDCHSGDLEEVWATLFEHDEFSEEFDVRSPSGDLLYIDTIALKPKYMARPVYYQVVETAIAMFASRGPVVAYKATFQDDPKRWRKLGFAEIPNSELLVRRVKGIRFGF
jgi:hypothetical protein